MGRVSCKGDGDACGVDSDAVRWERGHTIASTDIDEARLIAGSVGDGTRGGGYVSTFIHHNPFHRLRRPMPPFLRHVTHFHVSLHGKYTIGNMAKKYVTERRVVTSASIASQYSRDSFDMGRRAIISSPLLDWKLPVSYSSQRARIRIGGEKQDQTKVTGD